MQNYSYARPSEETVLFPEEPVVYGSFWARLAASLLDAIILFFPNVILNLIFPVGGLLLGIILGWLYSALQESGPSRATLGKKALGLKVCTVEGGGPSFGQATGRHFGKYLSSLILGIGYLMMLWDDNRQTLHDKMAGTLIISN
jgi:uncharacterized RDD family membrane protein YckC